MPLIERSIPFRKYSCFELVAILEILPELVRKGAVPPTIFFAEWTPRTLTIPRWQTINDVNIERCIESGIPVIYTNCGRAFLNTERELYFSVVAKPKNTGINIVENYRIVEENIVHALKNLGIPAYASYRIGQDGKRYGHDIKVGNPSSTPYFQNMLAALASAGDSNHVFTRHGAIFYEEYTDLDVQQMLNVMNVPSSINLKDAVEQLKGFSSPICRHAAVSKEQLCEVIASSFGMESWSRWTDKEQVLFRARAIELERQCSSKGYYQDLPGVRSRGLCMFNWGEQFAYREG